MRLNASIDVARFLLTSEFPFRGHDESEGSEYKGAFLELLKWYGDRSFDVGRVILGNAPQNDMMICPTIQKILWRLVLKTTKVIIEDLDGDCFGILVDESNDISHKEQMALILRYVNKSGMVIDRFLDQDIVNAMGLLDLSKRLQMMREDEWDSMMDEVSLFCGKHGISIPKMNEDYSNGKPKSKRSNISYLHHFRVEVFYAVIDLVLQELNNRFDVVTSDLLLDNGARILEITDRLWVFASRV
ncbi:hypothetical protein H5410_026299 [Solanum commersonii]|uniref:DUF4371 domain-containing protein n=1 Tax=Solanum commersonii TaxID=4109 RepID=A0A9J5YYK0_SOLCO|nr:hypothetical protein H5410_026299 [Solanum commersonii]